MMICSRWDKGINNYWCATISRVLIVAIAPCHAFAATELNQRYVQRDLLVILVACLTLVLFYVIRGGDSRVRLMPLGRRLEDVKKAVIRTKLSSLDSLLSSGGAAVSSWEPMRLGSFVVSRGNDLRFWEIDLFAVRPMKQLVGREMEYSLFAKNLDEAEILVAPILRKIFAKYREQFEIVEPISVVRDLTEHECVTWLPNEAAIRGAVFGFLDEALNISKALDASPSLEICRGAAFALTVTWPRLEWIENLQFFEKLTSDHLVDLVIYSDRIGLSLRVSFSRKQVPSRVLAALQARSA